MRARRILFIVLALASVCRADDDARARVARFLTQGALAPCTDVADLTSEAPLAPGVRTFARKGELVVSVAASGEVSFFSRSKPLLFVLGRGRASRRAGRIGSTCRSTRRTEA
jgi:hypothetical protein